MIQSTTRPTTTITTLRSQSEEPTRTGREAINLEMQDVEREVVKKRNKPVELDNSNREDDSDFDDDENRIQYGRPELQEFDPKLLSPPKYTKIKDSVKKRVKAGITNIIVFVWDLLFLISSIILLVVYYKECSRCEQPIWSWVLVNACASLVCCSAVLFVKGKKSGWTIYGVYLVAKESSCVVIDGVANGAHLFSIICVSSNFLQTVFITLVGSFLIGVKISHTIQEEKKKKLEERRSLLEYDKLYSVVNQSDTTPLSSQQDDGQEPEYEYPILIEKPIPTSDFSFPVDEIIIQDDDEVVQDEADVEHVPLDPIDEIKLKFNL